jgi:sec-independent protein translocase protein TatA
MDEPWVWAIIALVAVVLFGGKRLPDAARGIGRSLRIFKAETKGLLTDEDQPASPAQIQAAPAAPVYAPPVQQAPAPVYAAPVQQAPAPVYAAPVQQAPAPVYAAPVQQAPVAAPAPAEQPVPEHHDAQ